MFSSILAYQLIDLVVALFVAWLVARRFPRALEARLVRRFPNALATPFRRFAWLRFPAFALVMAVACVGGQTIFFPLLDRLAKPWPSVQYGIHVSGFLLLGATFLGFFVVFPLAAAWSAWREPAATAAEFARRRNDRRFVSFALAAVALFLYDTVVFEPNHAVVREADVELAGWPEGRPPLDVVLISDVQSALLGARERQLVDVVAALKPDLVVVAGDTIAQSFDESLPLEQARFVASHLSARLGVFAVNGDVDETLDGGIRRILDGTPAHLLENESVVLPSDPPIELAGFDPREPSGYARALKSPAKCALRIALVHRPRHWKELSAAGFPLVMAGHTHGGQVVLPGFGPLITLDPVPRDIGAGGLHPMNEKTQLYVTRGFGIEGGFAPPIRFCCRPEITLLHLGPRADARVGPRRASREDPPKQSGDGSPTERTAHASTAGG